jgi:hypothetical protein
VKTNNERYLTIVLENLFFVFVFLLKIKIEKFENIRGMRRLLRMRRKSLEGKTQ